MISNTCIKQILNHIIFFLIIISAKGQEKAIIGVTNSGGSDNLGVIFKTDINGDNYTVLQELKYTNPGSSPDNSALCEVNGKLYGTTGYGGRYDKGTLYEYDLATSTHTKLHDFDGENTGRTPYSNVILASNGMLYGTTLKGGANDVGTLFEYNIATKTLAKKLDFGGTTLGMDVYANVVQASNGKLYGLTNRGGLNDYGVLYEYDYITDTFTKLIDFNGTNIGSSPTILVEVENGVMYGTTSAGGINDNGTIFKYTIATNTLEKKFDFNVDTSGSSLSLGLMLASNGNLYGLTRFGGLNNRGVLYEYNISTETFTKKIDLTTELGSIPSGRLLEVTSNKLYGFTNTGGVNNDGVIFEFDIQANTYTKKFDFEYSSSGRNPKGTFVQASNGKLYATAQYGGLGNAGTLFEYDVQTDDFQKKLDFNYAENGYAFRAGFAKGLNGNLYITTSAGGLYGSYGTLLEYNPDDNTLVKKFDFNHNEAPQSSTDASVLYASNGKIYGVSTFMGGQEVLFEFDLETNTYTSKVAYNNATIGSAPSELIEATNGKIYGTASGGANNRGYIFQYDFVNDEYQNIYDFEGSDYGSSTKALFQASNGKLYGVSAYGGTNNKGILFEYDITTNTFTKKYDFTNLYKGVVASLIEVEEDVLYGFYAGGDTNRGGIFSYNINTNIFTDEFNVDATTWFVPQYRLLKTSENKLFGLSNYSNFSGLNNDGFLFQFSPDTKAFDNKFDFYDNVGVRPVGAPVEANISVALSLSDVEYQKAISIYPNPAADVLSITSKTIEKHKVQIYDVLGKLILLKVYTDNSDDLNISHLDTGLYILKVTLKNGSNETIKFLKN